MPGAEWFPGARLNYAERLFRGKPDERVAILHASELRAARRSGPGASCASRRRASAPACARAASAPATASPPTCRTSRRRSRRSSRRRRSARSGPRAAPEFGARSVFDRFGQIEPKVLLAIDGYRYGGKRLRPRARPSPRSRAEIGAPVVRLGYLDGSGWEDGFLGDAPTLEFEPVPFDHPLWVLYSSGTTGLPKAIVQGQGGILLEHLKKMYLHLDAHEGDRVFWFTTTGWMMWNFLVSVLLTDAAIVLYDGNPGAPDLNRLWDLAEETRMTCFGTSASYIASCMKAGVEPAAGRDLSRAARGRLDRLAARARGLRVGLRARRARHVAVLHLRRDRRVHGVRRRLPGAARLPGRAAGALARRRPARVRRGGPRRSIERGRRARDHAADAVDAAVLLGRRGRLAPARGLLRHYPGVWRHGDWIRITERGTAVIYGRSDSTINRGGVRMGTSEIYRAVLAVPRGRRRARRRRAARRERRTGCRCSSCCARARSSTTSSSAAIRRRVREDCSPRHVPSEVRAIAEVPRTLSGKVLEVPVKRILMGEPPERAASRDSLANPAALDYFVALARDASARGLAARRARAARAPRGKPARAAAASGQARPPQRPRATADGGCGRRRPARAAAPCARGSKPLAPQVRAQRVGPGEQQAGARCRGGGSRTSVVVQRERGGERRVLRAPVADRRGDRVERDRAGHQEHDRRDELERAEQRARPRRRRAPRPRRRPRARTATSHQSPPGTRASRRAEPAAGARRCARPTSRSTAAPSRRARRARPASRAAAAAAAAGRCGRRRRRATDSAPTAAIARPGTGAPIATSPPTAASAHPSASASASCGRTQCVSTHASCPRARRSSCAQTAARRSTSLQTARGANSAN